MRWNRRQLEDLGLLAGLGVLQFFLNLLPFSVAMRGARIIGALLAVIHRRKCIAYSNLRVAFGDGKSVEELGSIIRSNYQHLAMTCVEILRLPRLGRRYRERYIDVGDDVLRRVEAYRRSGRGIIFLAAHFGNWEIFHLARYYYGEGLHILARAQRHTLADRFLSRIRSSHGSELITRGMGVRRLYEKLERGAMAGILADQDAGRGGVFVPFFGRESSYPRGVARLSRETGAAILPVFPVRESGFRHRIVLGEDISCPEASDEEACEREIFQRYSRVLEAMIRQRPELWLWPYRRWKSSPNRDFLILSDGKAGHEKQSLALFHHIVARRGESGGRGEVNRLKTVRLHYRSEFHRRLLIATGYVSRGLFPGGYAILKAALTKESYERLVSAGADIVISCGSGTEAPNLIHSRRLGARSCYIHRPQFGLKRFTAVLVPLHDNGMSRRNVFRTRGAVHDPRLEKGSSPFAFSGEHALQKKIGFVIGGPARTMFWEEGIVDAALSVLKKIHDKRPFDLLATSSRRTPRRIEETMRRELGAWPPCRVLILPKEENPPGMYEALLSASDLLLVTADSVTMVSEAVGTGHPVIAIIPNRRGKTQGKLERFLLSLEESGEIERSGIEDLEARITRRLEDDPVRVRRMDPVYEGVVRTLV